MNDVTIILRKSRRRISTKAMLRSLALANTLLVGRALPRQAAPVAPPPAALIGEFRDDYGNSYHISDSAFVQLPRTRYRILAWNAAEQYLIAQNDSANQADAGLWTRIDWMPFDGMAPYTWGFCLTAYRAPSEAAARATQPANRANPRSGCNGFPFSRMRRVEEVP